MARRENEEEDPPPKDGTLILFTGLSMILLAFFIVLNSMATFDEARTRAALDSLLGVFGVMPGWEMTPGDVAPEFIGDPDVRLLNRVMAAFPDGRVNGVEVERREDGRIVIRIDDNVAFAAGGRRLSPAFFRTLDDLASLVAEIDYPVQVEGHTDTVPPSRRNSNWFLSAARAASVQRYLLETADLRAGLVTATGFAHTRPSPEDTAESNRRVEIVFLPPYD